MICVMCMIFLRTIQKINVIDTELLAASILDDVWLNSRVNRYKFWMLYYWDCRQDYICDCDS